MVKLIMITFFLNGGNSGANVLENITYRKNLIASLDSNSNVLFCYFGKPQIEWDKSFIRDSENLSSISGKLKFQMAHGIEFESQCSKAALIIFGGGDTFVLLEKLKNYPDLLDLIQDKVVAGSSAGACALSKYFYSNDAEKPGNGLGILNLKIICHYELNKLASVKKLREYKEDLPILSLAEQQFVRIFN